jgi:hypothetical protein
MSELGFIGWFGCMGWICFIPNIPHIPYIPVQTFRSTFKRAAVEDMGAEQERLL